LSKLISFLPSVYLNNECNFFGAQIAAKHNSRLVKKLLKDKNVKSSRLSLVNI
jgi:hypothetical protein